MASGRLVRDASSPETRDPPNAASTPVPAAGPVAGVSIEGVGHGLLNRAGIGKNRPSADLLIKLATPAVFENPLVDLQDSIVQRLEKQVEARSNERQRAQDAIDELAARFYGPDPHQPRKRTRQEEMKHNSEVEQRTAALPADLDQKILYLGTVVITEVPSLKKDGVDRLIRGSALVETDNAVTNSPSLNLATTDPGLAADIVRNTIRTMELAEQLTYLRKSGFLGKKWHVLVEIHYYRNRPRGMTGLHKDTLGQTLFVNLNYTNKEKDVGPEFLLNPPLVPTHEKHIAAALPEEFLSDLAAVRKATPFQATVRTKDLPPNAVVSFVDEAIHHATPLVGHREVALNQLREFLATDADFSAVFPSAAAAYLGSSAAPGSAERKVEFLDRFNGVTDPDAQQRWYRLIKICASHNDVPQPAAATPAARMQPKRDEAAGSKRTTKPEPEPEKTKSGRPRKALVDVPDTAAHAEPIWPPGLGTVQRPDLLEVMSPPQIDRLLASYAGDAFNSVSIPAAARADLTPGQREPLLDGSGQPIPLTREMSQRALKKPPATPIDTPRRFFRTWVRAVPNVDQRSPRFF